MRIDLRRVFNAEWETKNYAKTAIMSELNEFRKSTYPKVDDTWESIAQAEMPEFELNEAVKLLQSWNLHVFMRKSPPPGSPREGNPILPSDIIFTESPKT